MADWLPICGENNHGCALQLAVDLIQMDSTNGGTSNITPANVEYVIMAADYIPEQDKRHMIGNYYILQNGSTLCHDQQSSASVLAHLHHLADHGHNGNDGSFGDQKRSNTSSNSSGGHGGSVSIHMVENDVTRHHAASNDVGVGKRSRTDTQSSTGGHAASTAAHGIILDHVPVSTSGHTRVASDLVLPGAVPVSSTVATPPATSASAAHRASISMSSSSTIAPIKPDVPVSSAATSSSAKQVQLDGRDTKQSVITTQMVHAYALPVHLSNNMMMHLFDSMIMVLVQRL